MKSFSSLAGDDSDLFIEFRADDYCRSRNLDRDGNENKAKTAKGKISFLSNDLDFGLMSEMQQLRSRWSITSWNKTSIKLSKDNNGNEVIEIELNDSFTVPPDTANTFSPVSRLLIIGLK